MKKISLIVPAFSYGPALERTVASTAPYSDDLVIISTALFPQDLEAMRNLTPKVVVLDWNYTLHNGFGEMMNRGTGDTKNDWCLLFGVGETFQREHRPMMSLLQTADPKMVYTCDHENDPNRWKRLWNKQSGVHWSGLIHEELVGGNQGGLMFRMQDTAKEDRNDPYETETLRAIKAILYHWQYRRLRRERERVLGGTNAGWLQFVDGSEEANLEFLSKWSPMVDAMESGDLPMFLSLIRHSVETGRTISGVNYNPTGQPMSQGA